MRIVSLVGRPMDGARRIQSDLPINGGDSGGPLVDERGEVVGVASFALRRSHGLAFALPFHHAIERFPRRPRARHLDRFRRWRERPACARRYKLDLA